MMNLKELLNELFDNYPKAAQDYSLDIWDRYYLEFERKQLTDDIKYVLKDNLKYDKLPSKDVK